MDSHSDWEMLVAFTQFPVLFGDYLLAHRVASGGMADVYCAKASGGEELNRLVAIKCMRPELCEDETFAAMFVDEAKLASQLTHANIVQILDLGRVDDQLYIAMEHIHGRDLANIIKTARNLGEDLPLGICAYVIAKAAEGLDFAHNMKTLDGKPLNIVHSDVSPQNILVSFDGEVKVVDFGIARADAGGQSGGSLKGKFAYMAPEQTVKGDIDCRVDIFALGSVLFELVTGERLFEAESQFGILEKVRIAEIPNLELTDPRIRGDLLNVLHDALAKNSEDRFSRAIEFAEALTPLLIEDKKIVGARRMAEFMRLLYADEMASGAARMKAAVELRRSDVGRVEQPAAAGPGNSATLETEVLATAGGELFAEESAAPAQDDTEAPEDQLYDVFGHDDLDDLDTDTPVDASPELDAEDTETGAEEDEASDDEPSADGDDASDDESYATAADASDDESHPDENDDSKQASDADADDEEPEDESSGELLGATAPSPAFDGAPPDDVVSQPSRRGRTGLVIGVLVGLLLIGATLALVVWPRARHRLLSDSRPVTVTGVGNTVVTPAPGSLLNNSDSDQNDADSGVAAEDGAEKPANVDGKPAGRSRYGYITVKTPGVASSRLFIDGREVRQKARRSVRVRIGRRKLTVIEVVKGKNGRTRIKDIRVGTSHTKGAPLTVIVRM